MLGLRRWDAGQGELPCMDVARFGMNVAKFGIFVAKLEILVAKLEISLGCCIFALVMHLREH